MRAIRTSGRRESRCIRGLLLPERTGSGYREYSDEDALRVVQITAMIRAGLNTATIGRFLECARTGEHGTSLELCPDLTAELAAVADRLEMRQAELRDQQSRLAELSAVE